MTARTRAASALMTVAVLFVIAAQSQWPVTLGTDHALVRLSWRTAPVRVEACRQLTEEEQSAVAPHMRRSEECTGGYAEYRLELRIDGLDSTVDTIAPSGLRRDRPVYVFVDRPVPPGTYRISVTFTPLLPEGTDPVGDALSFEGSMALATGQVGLITLDGDARTLVRAGARP